MPTSVPPRIRRLAAVPALALVASLLPLTAQPAVAAPTKPIDPPATATAGTHKAQPEPDKVASTNSGTIRIMSPAKGALVSGSPLRAKVRVAGGTRAFKATLDGRVVTSSFHRKGHYWVGKVKKVRAGVNTLDVTVVIDGKKARAFSQITVKGQHRRDLVTVVRPRSRLLTGATDPGVKPIAVRIDPTATASATLNGKSVTLPAAEVGSVRSFLLSRRDGLRRGHNTFVVTAYRTNGQWDSSTTHFTVDRTTPLAEAGANVLARQGDTLTLDGSSSLSSSRGTKLGYQWTLLQVPAGATPPPAAAPGPKSTLKLATPGQYLVKLSVTQRQGSRVLRSSDLLSIDTLAGAPPIGQRLVTLADDPSGKTSGPGLLLGDDWYPWSKYFGTEKAGVFAYNPRSLTSPVVNDAPLLPAPLRTATLDDDIKTFLGKTPAGTILIFMGLDGCCSGSQWFPHSGAFSHIVAYSGATVPGNLGDGAWNRGVQLSDGIRPLGASGSLSGYLRYQTGLSQPSTGGGNDGRSGGYFRFVQDDNVPFDTSAPNIATTGATDGATYRLSLAADQTKAIGRPGASDSALLLQAPSADPAQQWQLVRAYGSFYRLVNRLDNRCMDVNGGDNVTVGAYTCDPNGVDQPNQLWLPTWNAAAHGWVLRSGLTPDATTVKVLTRSDSGLVLEDNNAIADQAWTFDLAPGIYTITSRVNAKAAGEPDYAGKDGAQLVTSPLSGELNQQWRLLDRPGHSVALQNVASQLCLNVAGGSSAENAAIVDTACDDGQTSQRWTAWSSSNGLYLRSVASGLDLSADTSGKLVQVAFDDRSPQPPVWNLNRQPDPVLNGYYSVSSAGTGHTLQAVGTGTAVRPAAASTADQNWTMREAWNAKPGQGLVMLVNERTGQCLNKTSGSPFANPIAVGPGPCAFWDDSPESTWRRVVNSDGTYTLQTIDTPNAPLRLLTAADDGTLSGTERTGADNQKWLFTGRPITFQVGQHRYSTSLPTGGSGFAVMATDSAVRPVAGYPRVFLTNGRGDSGADQTGLGNALKTLGGTPGTTVLVQTTGRPRPNTTQWNTIADGMAAIGARRPLVLGLDGTGDLAVAGCAGCAEGTQPTYSESVSRSADSSVVGARLEGTLTRDGASTLKAAQTTAAIVDDTFADLANRPTTPWPFGNPDDPGYPVLAAVSSKLNLPDTCGSASGLDQVRAAYCLWQDQEQVNWTAETVALDKLSLSDISGSMTKPVSEATFDQVKAQLEVEWAQLPKVHAMLKGQIEIYQSAVYANSSATQSVAQAIKADMEGRKQTSKDVVGGVFDVLTDTYHLLKPLAPLVLAAPHAGKNTPGGDEPENPVPDVAESTVALIKDIVKLAGDNNDASKGVGLHIDTDALAYAAQLDVQYGQVIANVSTVENIIVTDPVKLAITAGNSTNTWQVTEDQANQQVNALADGARRNTWTHLLPTVYEMWHWSSNYYNSISVDQISCYKANPLPSWHFIYTGQDGRGVFRLVTQVGSNGQATATDLDILTAATDPDLTHDVDRVFDSRIADAFYAGTHIPQAEVPWLSLTWQSHQVYPSHAPTCDLRSR